MEEENRIYICINYKRSSLYDDFKIKNAAQILLGSEDDISDAEIDDILGLQGIDAGLGTGSSLDRGFGFGVGVGIRYRRLFRQGVWVRGWCGD